MTFTSEQYDGIRRSSLKCKNITKWREFPLKHKNRNELATVYRFFNKSCFVYESSLLRSSQINSGGLLMDFENNN